MKAIIGLGNPGKKYQNNRHNIGCWVVEELSRKRWLEFKRRAKYRSFIAQDKDLIIARPRTFMNLSGEAVLAIKAACGIKNKDILVILDDVYLPLGTLRMRRSGSSGGHNGLLSVIENLGEENFPRLRVGVSSASLAAGVSLEDFVLSDFTREEIPQAKKAARRAAQAALSWLTEGIEKVMHKFNQQE